MAFLFQNEVHLIKVGDKVGASEATLLNMLKISPFSYGLIIQQGKSLAFCCPKRNGVKIYIHIYMRKCCRRLQKSAHTLSCCTLYQQSVVSHDESFTAPV